ncbi:cytosolic sulfotransferase 2-like [Brienomyrus brachyistius]|uniref:cytosolic sulfotransferase 2-like n=1 Tax=Brienomyrus brachyistius TaxID=42636 RepID=UPI0020B2A889|nr:cytosolic sulfotransferase 2-like [Brienomyrus brachyistius]XP_048874189.1 cytosolic sulfotransferase 2-like [Brienomyrus brachyistius]XP_048874190.1 cytosolic sulfotransferase 2-like [Brienomyrus brachyistius]
MDLSRPELFDFHGVSMIHCFTEKWDKVQNFKARPDDIVIATYPKAGTTWVSQIVDLLSFGKSDPAREASIPIYERVPFLEMSIPNFFMGTELAEKMTSVPRIIKTHFPVQFVPKSFWEENCKIIYVARNAKDTAVSFFHFDRMNMVQPEPGDWPSYLQRFQDGKVVFGSWYDHVKGWWEKKQTYANIHYMFYEDLIEDTAQEIEKICSFLNISPTQEEKCRVRREVGFDVMKKNEMTNYSTLGVLDFKISPFMRKGKVSDWKNHFTVAQNEQFDEVYQKKMANTTLRFRTEI